MSLDPVRSASPASSDTSLNKSRWRAQEDIFKKDKNYRRYAASVERALSLFDTALQEWADYISFLSRLLKALQSHPPNLNVVPSKTLVAKRLAQCLNPSLPSGVHQKALEVYAFVFTLLKPEGLAQDLSLYFPGIAPTLTFASLSVRPLFLSLVENYIVGLDVASIRPALKAIILALLPGLEEETSEDFEATLRVLNMFRDKPHQISSSTSRADAEQSSQYFWQCLFLASITNPSRRLGVLAYLNRHLPKLGIVDPKRLLSKTDDSNAIQDMSVEIETVISPEPGLLVRCFATGLADQQLLVQRNFLDLLVSHLPLHSPVLQSRITSIDLERLVTAASSVVTRRDMSLNRRLWAWFLGPDTSGDSKDDTAPTSPNNSAKQVAGVGSHSAESLQTLYFNRFGMKPLVGSIQNMIERDSLVPAERAKPFRISLSLMDRWEVGGSVVPEVFLPIMRSVRQFEKVASSKSQFDEVFRSASVFFDGVESSLIFSELLGLTALNLTSLEEDFDRVVGNLKLARFILYNFNVREEEMLLIHVPLLILTSLIRMESLSSVNGAENVALEQRLTVLNLTSKIVNQLIDLLPERALSRNYSATATDGTSSQGNNSGLNLLKKIQQFYDQSRDSLDLPPLPLAQKVLAESIVGEAHSLVFSSLELPDDRFLLKERINLLIAVLKKTPKSRVLRDGKLFQAMLDRLTSNKVSSFALPFSTLSAITYASTTLYTLHTTGYYITYDQLCELIPLLVEQLWGYLSPTNPKFHVEAVRSLWHLHSISWNDHFVEASISSIMIRPGSRSSHVTSAEEAEKFFVFWNHSHHSNFEPPTLSAKDQKTNRSIPKEDQALYRSSLVDRPLFLVLDLLSEPGTEACRAVKEWLEDLPSIQRIFQTIVSKLSDALPSASSAQSTTGNGLPPQYDAKECCYFFKTISHILSILSQNGWSELSMNTVATFDTNVHPAPEETPFESLSLQISILQACTEALTKVRQLTRDPNSDENVLQQTVLAVVRQMLLGPAAEQLLELELHTFLIDRLFFALDNNHAVLQASIIDTLIPALKVHFAHVPLEYVAPASKHRRAGSRETLASISRLSLNTEKTEKEPLPPVPLPPPQLLDCIVKGLSSPSSRPIIEKWVLLLCECLPLYSSAIFQILLTLVGCFCREIRAAYDGLQDAFRKSEGKFQDHAEHVTIALLAGLENCIARGHERLIVEEANHPTVKSPDQPQGFFGNMVSGVFNSEGNQNRSSTNNNRLTVLLCFQDAVKLCFSIWSWGSVGRSGAIQDPESLASFQYTSLRMRNRSRRILEHLFTAEVLECLETLVELWSKPTVPEESVLIFNLLHTLDGSRPKTTIPAIFNAIYSRTNPSALDPSRTSALTSNLTEVELTAFLVTYARSLDDDFLDDIWMDCTTFLRDVLANPFPHRQILPRLMEFAAIIGQKLDNTNFGDDRRMRKDLGDILMRLLTAIFTSGPVSFSRDSVLPEKTLERQDSMQAQMAPRQAGPDDIVSILVSSMPAFATTMGETDRITSAVSSISVNVIGPLFRSRLFPNNVDANALELLNQLSKIPTASKVWRKDVGDALNDPKFFGTQLDLVKKQWLGLLRHWVVLDKDRMPELLSRLTSPTTAGIMFGVGASAARLEADRKAQLNLRRTALLVLAANEDHFAGELSDLQHKLEDLLGATHISSPSSATRAEIFMVLRAVVLNTSTIHLAQFWPVINAELHEAISAIAPSQQSETYNSYGLLQACKLLETLLLIAPDDFQLQEWLFVTDTIDAVYPPHRWEPSALADDVSRDLGVMHEVTSSLLGDPSDSSSALKRPRLRSDRIRETAKDELVDRVLRPFFSQLSIHAFESTYSLRIPDIEACKDDLLADLFNESTMAN